MTLLENISHVIDFGIIRRSLGPPESTERLGGGLLRKGRGTAWRSDHHNFTLDFYSLVYVITGRGSYTDHRGTHYELQAGDIFMRYPGISHSSTVDRDQPWLELFIDFGPQLAAALRAMGIIDPDTPVLSPGYDEALITRAAQLLERLHLSSQPNVAGLFPEIVELHHQLIERGRESSDEQNMTERACAILAQEIETRIEIQKLCEREGWGYESFRKLFTKQLGISPAQYRIRLRMDRACHLLTSRPEHTIAEIATRLGYTNANEFSAQFKRRFNTTPLQYRAQTRR